MTRRPRLIVVTGTDTGVGKTFVTAALTRWLRSNGIDAVALKPIETGWDETTSDARVLADASGRSVADTVWQHFALPAAPKVAAEAEARTIDRAELARWVWDAAAGSQVCFVEGAGGWLVPMGRGWRFRDAARDLSSRVLVVGRAGLGTINHSLLTLDAVQNTAQVIAMVLSVRPDDTPQVAHSNRTEIEAWTRVPIRLIPDDLAGLGTQLHVELTTGGR